MVLDLGTGDGRAVLARVAATPSDLVIGLDAAAASMARAARRADRARIPNALFLAAGVEGIPGGPLDGAADLVTVTFPWGSLLRGVLGLDAAALDGIAAALGPDGRLEVLTSVVPSDRVAGLPALSAATEPAIREAWTAAGLSLDEFRGATDAEIRASGSSWARRLRSTGGERPVWRLTGTRALGRRHARPGIVAGCEPAMSPSSG